MIELLTQLKLIGKAPTVKQRLFAKTAEALKENTLLLEVKL